MPIQVWNNKNDTSVYITSTAFSPGLYKLDLVYSVLHVGLQKQMRNSIQVNFKPFKNAWIFSSSARKSVSNVLFITQMCFNENT